MKLTDPPAEEDENPTDFGGREGTGFNEGVWRKSLGYGNPDVIDGPVVTVSDARTIRRRRRRLAHRDCKDFFTNILDLEPQCSDASFVDYLTDTWNFSIRGQYIAFGQEINYTVKYLEGEFKSNRLTEDEIDLLRDGIRE